MKSSLKIYFLIFVFVIFSTFNTKYNKESISFFFPVKKILVENNVATDLFELKSNLNFLLNTSLFFLNREEISKVIRKHNFILNIQLKKKYPSTLKIVIIEKIPVVIQISGEKKFYITKKNEKINFIDLQIYDHLPLVFGKYKNFDIFYNALEKNNFKINEIKSFYYFDVGRWDIVLKNEKVIKLPEKNYLNLLPKINSIINDDSFSKFIVFDFRIEDQLILK